MKKVLASALSAAIVITGPGYSIAFAANMDGVRDVPAVNGPIAGVQAGAIDMGAITVVPVANLSAVGLDAAAKASLPEAVQADGGTRLAPVTAAKGETAAQGLTEAAHQLGAEESGSQAAEITLNNLYSHDGAKADSVGGVAAEGLGSAKVESKLGRALAARERKDGGASVVGTVILTAAVAGAAGMAIPRTRNLIVFHYNRFMNKYVRNPDTVAKGILARLDEGHMAYNKKVNDAKGQVAEYERKLQKEEAELTPIKKEFDEKVEQAKAAADGSAARNAARGEAVTLKAKMDRIQVGIDGAKRDRDQAQKTYEEFMAEREQYFNQEAEQMAEISNRLSDLERGRMRQAMAGMKAKYQLASKDDMDVLTGQTNSELAKGDAAVDAVNSSGAAQKANAEQGARKRSQEDAVDALINGKNDKGGSSIDAGTWKMLRYGTWAVGAAFVFINPGMALPLLAGLGFIALLGSQYAPAQAQHLGGDIAIISGGTLAIGLLASKIGIGVTMVGSATFVAVGVGGLVLGTLAAINGYRHRYAGAQAASEPIQMPAAQPMNIFGQFGGIGSKLSRAVDAAGKMASAGKTAAGAVAGQAGSAASNAAETGVGAMERAAERATQVADGMSKTAPADAPSTGELAQRAGDAAKTTAGAIGTIAGAAANQAGAQARHAADQGVSVMEQIAQTAAEKAGAMSAQAGVEAPSAKELLGRLQKLSGKLGDIGMTVAEQQVNKLEQKVDPNAPKMDNANSIVALAKRAISAIATLIGMQVDAALTNAEKSPEYQAYLMKAKLAAAEKQYQKTVYDASYAYHLKEIEIDQAKQASDKLAGQIATLLSPRPNGDAPSAQNEHDAAVLVGQKRVVDLGMIAGLKALNVAKQALDAAIEQRATVFADATEKMIGIKEGLTEAEIGDLKARVAMVEQDVIQGLNETSERFKAAVAAHIAAGQAASDVAAGNPAVEIAQAEQHARSISTADEVARIKAQLASK